MRVLSRQQAPAAQAGEIPAWTTAAAVCEQSLSGRIPAATQNAIIEFFRSVDTGQFPATCAGVPRCTGTHGPLCQSACTFQTGGYLVLIVGEHVAVAPEVAAGTIAHEARHLSRRVARGSAVFARLADRQGWLLAGIGWAVAGWITPAATWPWLLAAVAAVWVVIVAVQWAAEGICDIAAARVGCDMRTTLSYYAGLRTTRREGKRIQRAPRELLHWLAAPGHPPIWLRRLVVAVGTLPRGRG